MNEAMKRLLSSDVAPVDEGASLQGERGELQARNPPFGALLQRGDVLGWKVQTHAVGEELGRLGRGEAEVGRGTRPVGPGRAGGPTAARDLRESPRRGVAVTAGVRPRTRGPALRPVIRSGGSRRGRGRQETGARRSRSASAVRTGSSWGGSGGRGGRGGPPASRSGATVSKAAARYARKRAR